MWGMAAPQTPVETFKRALAQTARALAEKAELEVNFSNEGPRLTNGVLTLPHPPRDPAAPESANLRGQADRLALRLSNHDGSINARQRPIERDAAEVFDAIEQARIEAVGARGMKGVQANLDAALITRLEKSGLLRAEADRVPVAEAAALLVRERLTGEAVPGPAKTMLDQVRAQLEAKASQQLDSLVAVAHDQDALPAR